MGYTFDEWYSSESYIKGVIHLIDKDALRDFIYKWVSEYYGELNYEKRKDNFYEIDADNEVILNFEPFPKEWECTRNLIRTIINTKEECDYTLNGGRFDYIDLDFQIDESIIELILDVLEERLEFGVCEKYYNYGNVGREIVVSFDGYDGRWVVPPNKKVEVKNE